MSCPQINNGPFHFDCEERWKRKYQKFGFSEKKVNIIREREREIVLMSTTAAYVYEMGKKN